MDGEVSPGDVERLVDEDANVRVVDIRSPRAFAGGHIPESENVPFQQLPDRIEELRDAERIVIVCPHGKASVQAARLVKSFEGTADATVESMAGGLSEWEGDLETDAPEREADEGPESPF